MNQEYVIGDLQAIFFEKFGDYFKILLIKVQETSFAWADNEIVVTGDFDDLEENQLYKFTGQVVNHPKYGQQFKCDHYQKDSPVDRKGLEDYFSSAEFPGIGRKTAAKIVDVLGENAISLLVGKPEIVKELPLSTEKQQMILDKVNDSYQSQEIILQLHHFGFGNKVAFKIYHKYGLKTLDILRTDPYQLIYDIKGIGFQRADQLARNFGIESTDSKRLQAGLLQALNGLVSATGDTYVKEQDLFAMTSKMLNGAAVNEVTMDLLETAKYELLDNGRIVEEDKCYFPKYLYDGEFDIAEKLHLLTDKSKRQKYSTAKIKDALKKMETTTHINYDKQQLKAIKQGLNSAVFLLTGGPGTGKTTIINGLVTAFAHLNDYSLDPKDYQDTPFPIVLAAPTGRAAKHLAESTQLNASTIHRLLGLTGQEEGADLETNEIFGKLLIIDETSMVDTNLFKMLVDAIAYGMQIVLVGDRDQLPSVGPGQVFSDLIASDVFPTINLTKIYRQDKDSTIIDLAHDINDGKMSAQFFQNYADRSFIECSAAQVPNVLNQIALKSSAHGFDLEQMQVLAPMYRGPAGIDNLNQAMQDTLNPTHATSKTINFGETQYRIGDKVVHLVNNGEKNVFNGEIGRITGITLAKDNPDKKKGDVMYIEFDGRQIAYGRADLANISLAYCTSIHKAQGSEFDLVILVLVRQNVRMLRRNLLYTAVTRAKSKLIMLGDREAYQQAVADNSSQRQTKLQQRLQQVFGLEVDNKPTETIDIVSEPEDYILTPEKIRSHQIDPLIGMEGITPLDFLEQS